MAPPPRGVGEAVFLGIGVSRGGRVESARVTGHTHQFLLEKRRSAKSTAPASALCLAWIIDIWHTHGEKRLKEPTELCYYDDWCEWQGEVGEMYAKSRAAVDLYLESAEAALQRDDIDLYSKVLDSLHETDWIKLAKRYNPMSSAICSVRYVLSKHANKRIKLKQRECPCQSSRAGQSARAYDGPKRTFMEKRVSVAAERYVAGHVYFLPIANTKTQDIMRDLLNTLEICLLGRYKALHTTFIRDITLQAEEDFANHYASHHEDDQPMGYFWINHIGDIMQAVASLIAEEEAKAAPVSVKRKNESAELDDSPEPDKKKRRSGVGARHDGAAVSGEVTNADEAGMSASSSPSPDADSEDEGDTLAPTVTSRKS